MTSLWLMFAYVGYIDFEFCCMNYKDIKIFWSGLILNKAADKCCIELNNVGYAGKNVAEIELQHRCVNVDKCGHHTSNIFFYCIV